MQENLESSRNELVFFSYFSWQASKIITSLWKKRGKTGPTVQSFAGFNDDKPVVIGLSENMNRFMCEYKPSWLVYFDI